jgi:hypothetical protein
MWDTKFWTKTDWPRDSASHVFLGRAFDRVGKVMFGLEWKGVEARVEIPDPMAILELDGYDLTPKSWERAQRIHRDMYFDREPYLRRRKGVCDAIIAGCQSGSIKAFYRPLPGGDFTPFAPEWWNTERTPQRFYFCQINPNDPYSIEVTGDNFCWIFLSADSLDQFLVQQRYSEVRAQFDMHLSPYLAVMLAVASKMKITPEHQPKKEEVLAELKAAWTAEEPLSANLIDTMATLLREPSSQLGRAKKPEKTIKKLS